MSNLFRFAKFILTKMATNFSQKKYILVDKNMQI